MYNFLLCNKKVLLKSCIVNSLKMYLFIFYVFYKLGIETLLNRMLK